MVRRLGVALLCFATGCGLAGIDPPDPLDPGNIGDISNDPGDAIGSAYSGTYDLTATQLDCDCPMLTAEDFPGGGEGLGLEPGQVVDPCVELDTFYGRPIESGGIIEIEQTDGYSAWTNWIPELLGPVNQDGSFVVAGYEDFSETFLNAQMVSRVDGRHMSIDRFTGIMRQRVIAELPGLNLDCRSSHQIDAVRVAVDN